jgi:hypothetical protein
MHDTGKDPTVKSKRNIIKGVILAILPALAVLIITLILSAFIAEYTIVGEITAPWRILFRFLRLLLILTLPLLLLPLICSGLRYLFNRASGRLIQLPEFRNLLFNPLQTWLIRPLQGIGLAMLIATRLLSFLQIQTQGLISASAILPPLQFNPWRFFSTFSIAAVTALLLSIFWSMNDLGIRYYNMKTTEIRMIGKYLGLLLPVLFGSYGIISLLENYAHPAAAQYIVQMAIILYPPFVVFGAAHNFYIQKYEALLLKKLRVEEYVVHINRKKSEASMT